MSNKKIQKIEKRIHDIAELLFILRTYCKYNGKYYEVLEYVNEMLEKISDKVDKVSAVL